MSENLPPHISKKLRALCWKIIEAHHLDEHARDELFLRMEKKLNEYISGKEILTEEEAFILVQEHFGKPEQIRELLERVHGMETQISLVRRIGTLLAATLGVGVLINVVVYMIHFPFNFLFGIRLEQPWLPGYLYIMLNPVILYIILKRWRITEERVGSVWFQKLPLYKMALFIVALFAADTVIPMVYYTAHYYFLHPPPFSSMILKGFGVTLHNHPNVGALMYFLSGNMSMNDTVFIWAALISSLVQCAVWLWWCDGASRKLTSRIATVCSWIAFVFLTAAYQPALGIGSDTTKHAVLFISWRDDNMGRFSTYTMTTVILGVCVMMIYILVQRILDSRKKEKVELIQR
jgi:hypothetical protein